MEKPHDVSEVIRKFIISNYLFGQERTIQDEDSFLAEGILDSTGVLELVAFLEETYGITVEDEELIPDNLDSISNVTAYLSKKLGVVANLPDTRDMKPWSDA